MMDWWQKREIDRQLATELHVAQETFRLANLKLRDLTAAVPTGIPADDSGMALHQAHGACVEAFGAWQHALDRWTKFVKSGTIPEDIKLDGTTS